MEKIRCELLGWEIDKTLCDYKGGNSPPNKECLKCNHYQNISKQKHIKKTKEKKINIEKRVSIKRLETMVLVAMKKKEEREKRALTKEKFITRNKIFKNLYEEYLKLKNEKNGATTDRYFELRNEMVSFFKKPYGSDPNLIHSLPSSISPLKYITSTEIQPSIQIKTRIRGHDAWLLLDYHEMPGDPKADELIKEVKAIHAVNKNRNTITIKVDLNRQKEDIIDDIQFLLLLLDKEAEQYGLSFLRFKPHWDIYDRYVKVYDLREMNWSWSRIAKEIFPKEITLRPAVDKVRHYYREAKKMIDGGWINI